MYKRYVDGILVAVRGVQPGVRYNPAKGNLEVVEGEIEGDLLIPEDQRTMKVLNDVANSIDIDIKLTIDCPSMNQSGKLPCLDLQLWLDSEGYIRHEFYSKPMTTPYIILRRSAVSNSVKRTTCFQEAIRRLRCCSQDLDWDTKAGHLTRFSWQMMVSGYPESYRRTIIGGAVKRYHDMVKTEKEGGSPSSGVNRRSFRRRKARREGVVLVGS